MSDLVSGNQDICKIEIISQILYIFSSCYTRGDYPAISSGIESFIAWFHERRSCIYVSRAKALTNALQAGPMKWLSESFRAIEKYSISRATDNRNCCFYFLICKTVYTFLLSFNLDIQLLNLFFFFYMILEDPRSRCQKHLIAYIWGDTKTKWSHASAHLLISRATNGIQLAAPRGPSGVQSN